MAMGLTRGELEMQSAITNACRKYSDKIGKVNWEKRTYELAKELYFEKMKHVINADAESCKEYTKDCVEKAKAFVNAYQEYVK